MRFSSNKFWFASKAIKELQKSLNSINSCIREKADNFAKHFHAEQTHSIQDAGLFLENIFGLFVMVCCVHLGLTSLQRLQNLGRCKIWFLEDQASDKVSQVLRLISNSEFIFCFKCITDYSRNSFKGLQNEVIYNHFFFSFFIIYHLSKAIIISKLFRTE